MRTNTALLALSLLFLAPGSSPGEPEVPREEVRVVFELKHANILKSYPGFERAKLEEAVVKGLINGPGEGDTNGPGDHGGNGSGAGTIKGLNEEFKFLNFSTNDQAKNRLVIRLTSRGPAGQASDIVFRIRVEGDSVCGTPPELEWKFRDYNDYDSPVKPPNTLARQIVTSFLGSLDPSGPGELLAKCLSSVKVREGGLRIESRSFAMPFSCRELFVSEWDSEFVAEVRIVPPNASPVDHRFVLRAHGLVHAPEDGDVEAGLQEYIGNIRAEAAETNPDKDLELLDDPACKVEVRRVFFTRYILSNKCLEPETPLEFTAGGGD